MDPPALVRTPWRSKKGRCIPVVEELVVLQVDGEVEPEIRLAWAEKVHWVSPQAVLSPRAALAVAHRWHLGPRHGGNDHRAAEAWLRAVPELAAIGLVPPALREPCVARTAAGRALRFLAGDVDREAVSRAAAYYGPEVAAMIRKVVELDPLEDCPVRAPRLPDYIQLDALPPVRLRDSKDALPEDAVKAVLEMLAFNALEAFRYVGLDQVAEACEPADLEQLVWSVFEAWREAGQSGQCTWPVAALGVFGGGAVAHRLARWLRKPEQARAPEAARVGLRALAGIGSEAALVQLAAIGERVRATRLREEARQVLAAVARQLGLSVDELTDRAVPDLGLGPDGSVTLDYADDPARRFRVVFNEELTPVIVDPTGRRLRSLPRPRDTDDPAAAARARGRWEELREHGKATARAQSARLERAMTTGRRWQAAAFLEHLVAHPLVGIVASRLLWRAESPGADGLLFRVAEDRTLADLDDAPVTLEPGWQIGLPHPVELAAETLARWGELFSDYELVQPFDQLGRVVFRPTDEERGGHLLTRFARAGIPTGRCFALDGWGWRQLREGPHVSAFERDLCDGLHAHLTVSPGFDLREVSDTPEQTLGRVQLRRRGAGPPPAFEQLPAVLFSELVRDLARLAG